LNYEGILYEVSGCLESDVNMLGEWFTKFWRILSLHIQASSSLRKTTNAEGLVTCVVSVGGWLEGVAFSVTVHLTTPFLRDIPLHPEHSYTPSWLTTLISHPPNSTTLSVYYHTFSTLVILLGLRDPWRCCDCVPPKCEEQLTQWHSIMSQNTWCNSSIIVRN